MHNELRQRIISGILLAAAVLLLTWWSFWSFAALCFIGGLILAREWWNLTKHRSHWFILLGTLYICAALDSLLYLRFASLPILFSLLAIVWGGDIAAYLVGRKFGKHKIAPAISPGKSWEGLAASIIASAAIGTSLGHIAPIPHAILGAALAVIGLLGDLFESSLKRHAGVKDSGRLIPGHGGLFDRVDALMPCAIVAAAALYFRLHSM